MADISVYVPDELKERLEAADLPRGLLSQVARAAWERHLQWMKEREEMEEIRIDTVDEDGNEVELRFTGDEVAVQFDAGVYRTDDGNAILVGEEGWSIWTPDKIDADEDGFSDGVEKALNEAGLDSEFANVLTAFDLKPVIKL